MDRAAACNARRLEHPICKIPVSAAKSLDFASSVLERLVEYALGCHCSDVSPHAGRPQVCWSPVPDSTRFPGKRRGLEALGASAQSRGWTPLLLAVDRGHAACVEVLLKAGAEKAPGPPGRSQGGFEGVFRGA